MIKCVSSKKVYLTEEMAEAALIDAQIRFDYGHRTGPIAVYRCDDCGHYHLTSKGPSNKKLSDMIANGQLKRLKESDRWAEKFKKK
jgi:hypothetical protein